MLKRKSNPFSYKLSSDVINFTFKYMTKLKIKERKSMVHKKYFQDDLQQDGNIT